MSQKTVVEIRNLTKVIGRKTIIDRLSFDVPKGEVFGFLGPNGAGKTTTIRMMVGLMSITEGDIFINGYHIKKDFEKAIAHVGAIVENPELYKFLTGYQNLIHYARMNEGISKERIDQLVHLLGMENRIHDKVKTYSLGMRQRLGVIQALLHKPNVLILDEPTNGLDPAGIRELRDYLRKLAQEEGIAVIVSSHLLSEMELMCDRIAIIQNGKLIDVKNIKELVNDVEQQRIFFEVDKPHQAQEIIQQQFQIEVQLVEGGFIAEIEREQIPKLNQLLVDSGLLIYEIKAITKSLEDKFLEMTGGGQIV